MASKWHMTRDRTTQFGPYEEEQLRQLVVDGRIVATDLLWQEGTPDWVPAASVPGLIATAASNPGAPAPPRAGYDVSSVSGTKIVAGLCGIFLGAIGIHKFVLGLTTPGVVMLLVTVFTCGIGSMIMVPIGIIEGIIYLTKSDEDFYQTYTVGKKGWF